MIQMMFRGGARVSRVPGSNCEGNRDGRSRDKYRGMGVSGKARCGIGMNREEGVLFILDASGNVPLLTWTTIPGGFWQG
ncbi:MAG: hypothetical protein V3V31_03835 [Methylococcales bacterium]